MLIDVLTLFPEMFSGVLGTSIIGRARGKEYWILTLLISGILLRTNINKSIIIHMWDRGWLCRRSPCLMFLSSIEASPTARVIYFSLRVNLRQEMAEKYANMSHLILLCGHYEGVDQRVIDRFVDEELSIGELCSNWWRATIHGLYRLYKPVDTGCAGQLPVCRR